MTAACPNDAVTEEEKNYALELLSSFGKVEIVPEHLIDAVVAVSGSSPAYIFMIIHKKICIVYIFSKIYCFFGKILLPSVYNSCISNAGHMKCHFFPRKLRLRAANANGRRV